MPQLDSHTPNNPPNSRRSKVPRLRGTPRGTQGAWTQGTRRVYHPQTNIEPTSKMHEPRKKKRNYWLLASNVLKFVKVQP